MTYIQSLFFYITIIILSYILTHFAEKKIAFGNTYIKVNTINNLLKIYDYKIFILLFTMLPLILAVTLRVNTGADYEQYIWNFENFYLINDKVSFIIRSREPLYYISQYIVIKLFGNNYYMWFAAMSIFTFVLIVKSLVKLNIKFDYGIFVLLFGFYVYMHMYNYVRQIFAMTLIGMAIVYICKHKKIKFLICILIASLMHQSSIIFLLVAIVFYKRKFFSSNMYHVLMLISPLCLNILVFLLKHIPYFSIYTVRYFNNGHDIGFGWIIDIIPILLLYMLINCNTANMEGRFFLELSWVIIPVRALSYYSYAAGRLFIDFAYITIIGFSILIHTQKYNKLKKVICISVFFAYYVYIFYIGNNSSVFPYNSVLLVG